MLNKLIDWFIGAERKREREREWQRAALRDAYVRGDIPEVKRLTKELAKSQGIAS